MFSFPIRRRRAFGNAVGESFWLFVWFHWSTFKEASLIIAWPIRFSICRIENHGV